MVGGRVYMASISKEKEPIESGRVRVEPEFPTVESPRKKDAPLEVESWITKIEKKFARVPKGAPGPQDDQVVVQQPQSKQPPIQLPVTQQNITIGQKAKPELSLAWLVAWAVRQIKIMARLGRKVELASLPEADGENTQEQQKK